MPEVMFDGKVVQIRGPDVEWIEREGIRVVTVLYRVGALAMTFSLSEDEARKLAADLSNATR